MESAAESRREAAYTVDAAQRAAEIAATKLWAVALRASRCQSEAAYARAEVLGLIEAWRLQLNLEFEVESSLALGGGDAFCLIGLKPSLAV